MPSFPITRCPSATGSVSYGIVSSERYKVRARHQDGSLFPVIIHGSLARYKGKPAIIGSLTAGDNT
ncbi:hypothetical protein [Methanoregula sp.]|uniref:hypothetical protein n=1 Tax=Methanoregula sp. TaxID=2052170 RepID=UPI00263018C0|nr:hypothetical protein [Methanoregula sp.]MDD5143928.1 hypothetical protein [Methanoregula sp.]